MSDFQICLDIPESKHTKKHISCQNYGMCQKLVLNFKIYMVLVVKQYTNFSHSFVKTYKISPEKKFTTLLTKGRLGGLLDP